MNKNAKSKLIMSRVTLGSAVIFSEAKQPALVELAQLHHHAQNECCIANSVQTGVRCEPQTKSVRTASVTDLRATRRQSGI